MPAPRGLVLYYCAGPQAEASRAKLVFIRFGLRIKVITPDLLSRAVGSFAGLDVPAPEDAGGGSIPDGVHALYFAFAGEGQMDVKSIVFVGWYCCLFSFAVCIKIRPGKSRDVFLSINLICNQPFFRL